MRWAMQRSFTVGSASEHPDVRPKMHQLTLHLALAYVVGMKTFQPFQCRTSSSQYYSTSSQNLVYFQWAMW